MSICNYFTLIKSGELFKTRLDFHNLYCSVIFHDRDSILKVLFWFFNRAPKNIASDFCNAFEKLRCKQNSQHFCIWQKIHFGTFTLEFLRNEDMKIPQASFVFCVVFLQVLLGAHIEIPVKNAESLMPSLICKFRMDFKVLLLPNAM